MGAVRFELTFPEGKLGLQSSAASHIRLTPGPGSRNRTGALADLQSAALPSWLSLGIGGALGSRTQPAGIPGIAALAVR